MKQPLKCMYVMSNNKRYLIKNKTQILLHVVSLFNIKHKQK